MRIEGDGAFVAVNCEAISPELLGRWLFGHERGSFPIGLPPLRERGDDVALLALRFLHDLNGRYDPHRELSDRSLQYLVEYRWPGNVREPRHAIQHAFVLADNGKLEVFARDPLGQDTPPSRRPGLWAGQTMDELQRDAIEQALRRSGNDRTRAARMLGISVKTIYDKLARYRQQGGQAD